jgi:hypothetical protein
VSKYENKFAKLQKKAAEFNFRNQLKTVKKKEFTMDEEEHAVRKAEEHRHCIANFAEKIQSLVNSFSMIPNARSL